MLKAQIGVHGRNWKKKMVWFYGISIIVGYLMPNPFLYIKSILFQTIQFSISTQFIWPIG